MQNKAKIKQNEGQSLTSPPLFECDVPSTRKKQENRLTMAAVSDLQLAKLDHETTQFSSQRTMTEEGIQNLLTMGQVLVGFPSGFLDRITFPLNQVLTRPTDSLNIQDVRLYL